MKLNSLPTDSKREVELKRFAERACYVLALAFLQTPLRKIGFRAPAQTQFESKERSLENRVNDIPEYCKLFRRFARFEGQIVVELGSNEGYLLKSFLETEKFTAIGADLNGSALDRGRANCGERIKFVQTTPTSIPLSDSSVDIFYTIDTIEHLSSPREIFMEVFRVLKPGGLFLVHFNPWLNPYGSHLGDIIPFPWPHVVFSMDTLLRVASKLYDSPAYPVAWYWYDDSGKKRPNPYVDRQGWDTFLNYMTIRRFNEFLKELPFEQLHQERIGFGGKTYKITRYLRGLSQVRGLDEFFTNALFTVLTKRRLH